MTGNHLASHIKVHLHGKSYLILIPLLTPHTAPRLAGSGSINDDLHHCGFVPDDEDDAAQADGDGNPNTQPTPTSATPLPL
jgi:hypothetical protein